MKTSLQTCLLLAVLLGLSSLARAAAPAINVVTALSVAQGEPTILHVGATDPDADLALAAFYVLGPGISGWLHVGDVNISGSSGSADFSWQAPQAGIYTLLVEVYDAAGQTSSQTTFEIFGSRLIVPKLTVADGANRMFEGIGEVVTTAHDTEKQVVVQNGGTLILWAGGRVILKPGFHAQEGSFFWAAVDHNMNGYSDMEEQEQNYISGVPDSWLVDHGVNLLTPISSWQYTPAQYLAAYQGGYAPNKESTPVPLVIFTPSS